MGGPEWRFDIRYWKSGTLLGGYDAYVKITKPLPVGGVGG